MTFINMALVGGFRGREDEEVVRERETDRERENDKRYYANHSKDNVTKVEKNERDIYK